MVFNVQAVSLNHPQFVQYHDLTDSNGGITQVYIFCAVIAVWLSVSEISNLNVRTGLPVSERKNMFNV